MKTLRSLIIASILLTIFFSCKNHTTKSDSKDIISHVSSQMDYALQVADSLRDSINIAPRTVLGGQIKLVAGRDWTSGFFPGNLWMVYELTKNEKWKEAAIQYTLPLENEQWDTGTHDLGFKMFGSFGKAYKHTGDSAYKAVLIQSARSLATRYNPTVGCIRSWDFGSWKFPVIIDNMMNLELLMWVAKHTNDTTLSNIAISHARTTIKNHFRENNSSYHVIDYNPETGEVEHRNTHQGYADDSAWARGQAWGLYGFTMMYRETGLSEFLEQAEKIAGFLLTQPGISEGKVPYWDFDAPNIPDEPYDASAAAVITSAFFELFEITGNNTYKTVAEKLLSTLESPQFLAEVGTNHGFLLMHTTGHFPKNSEVDVPMVYADYYLLESIIRKKRIEKNKAKAH
ncbi:MAG: glucuronyl hydrolase [Draconibacterium sp.]|nr:MAG: glucuronyl hydrolase [Draconibacterium sp.]